MTTKVRHVDIISNDPLAGEEHLIARVWMNGGPELELYISPESNADKEYMWSYLSSRVRLDPKEDPKGFLEALPLAIDATYVVASSVHEADDCPFGGTHPHHIT
jgi:hypothetical protein